MIYSRYVANRGVYEYSKTRPGSDWVALDEGFLRSLITVMFDHYSVVESMIPYNYGRHVEVAGWSTDKHIRIRIEHYVNSLGRGPTGEPIADIRGGPGSNGG